MPLKPPAITARTLSALRFQTNEAILQLSDYIEQIFGVDEKTFVSQNSIDMNSKPIRNVAESSTPTSVASVRQVTVVSGDLATVEADVAAQALEIDAVETDVAQLQVDLAALQAQVENMKIPIGGLIELTVATNPGTLFGYGTWAAWGTGRFTVAINAADVDFDTAEETGGAKTYDISHAHTIGHTHPAGTDVQIGAGEQVNDGAYVGSSGTAGSATQSILPPYVVCYKWKRTA